MSNFPFFAVSQRLRVPYATVLACLAWIESERRNGPFSRDLWQATHEADLIERQRRMIINREETTR